MLAEYFPVLLFILVGLGVGVAPMVLGKLLAPNRPDPEKLSPYECGFEAFEDARMKFDVRYYLVAILFILFDLEIEQNEQDCDEVVANVEFHPCVLEGLEAALVRRELLWIGSIRGKGAAN